MKTKSRSRKWSFAVPLSRSRYRSERWLTVVCLFVAADTEQPFCDRLKLGEYKKSPNRLIGALVSINFAIGWLAIISLENSLSRFQANHVAPSGNITYFRRWIHF